MSSTNKTPNYALPQFIPTDKPTWLGDVNAAMLAIDTAMADNHTTAESANTSASAAVAQVQLAVDTANEAKVDSAAALQNATNAIGVAQNALNSATQATQTAQAATQTANAANASSASAVATANQAKQTADATDAELTEFEHYFATNIPNIGGARGVVWAMPGSLYIDTDIITDDNTPMEVYKCHGELLAGIKSFAFNLSDAATIAFTYDIANDTTTISVTAPANKRYVTMVVISYPHFLYLKQKNPVTTKDIAPFIMCTWDVHNS